MLYIKRILFILIALIGFLISLIAFAVSSVIMPLYLFVYYVKHGCVEGASILPWYVIDFYDRFINKITPN